MMRKELIVRAEDAVGLLRDLLTAMTKEELLTFWERNSLLIQTLTATQGERDEAIPKTEST